MKLKYVLIIIVVLVICSGALIYYLVNNSAQVVTDENSLVWDTESTVVFEPENAAHGAFYPRMLVLKNGDWLVAYDTNDGAIETRIQVSRSRDKGKTWTVLSTASFGAGDAANAQMVQLPDGDVLLAYRVVNGHHKILKASRSSDNGETWEELSVIAEAMMDNYRGVWEPHMGFLPDGKLAVMYASEVYQPQFPQVIEMKVSDDFGKTWGDPIRVSDNVLSRDGMPVWTITKDNKVLAVFEATDDPTGFKPFIIRYKISEDGYDWSGERKILYSPTNAFNSVGAAPFVVTMPNGVLVASCQVDRNPGGIDMHTLWSLDSGDTWVVQQPAFESPGDDNWNALYPLKDGRIVALTSTYSGKNSRIEIKFGEIR